MQDYVEKFKICYEKSQDNLKPSMWRGDIFYSGSAHAGEVLKLLQQLETKVTRLQELHQQFLSSENLLPELALQLVSIIREIEGFEIPFFEETRNRNLGAIMGFAIGLIIAASMMAISCSGPAIPVILSFLVMIVFMPICLGICALITIMGAGCGLFFDDKMNRESVLPFTCAKQFAAAVKENSYLQPFFAQATNVATDANKEATSEAAELTNPLN